MVFTLKMPYLKRKVPPRGGGGGRAPIIFFFNVHVRTATPAVYILSGVLPAEAILHIRTLCLLGAISRSQNKTMVDLAIRQCATAKANSKSWFVYVSQLLDLYQLPDVVTVISQPCKKEAWKLQVKKAVHIRWKHIYYIYSRTQSTI